MIMKHTSAILSHEEHVLVELKLKAEDTRSAQRQAGRVNKFTHCFLMTYLQTNPKDGASVSSWVLSLDDVEGFGATVEQGDHEEVHTCDRWASRI